MTRLLSYISRARVDSTSSSIILDHRHHSHLRVSTDKNFRSASPNLLLAGRATKYVGECSRRENGNIPHLGPIVGIFIRIGFKEN